ncbi:MAG: hypothetical protein GY801_10855 [bacterium]|nr:hypothetical protein [bacterium]
MGGLIMLVIFGSIMAMLASKKGFNPFCWFFAAGPLGLIILVFFPSTEKSGLSREERLSRAKRGNTVGIVISVLAVGLGALLLVASL